MRLDRAVSEFCSFVPLINYLILKIAKGFTAVVGIQRLSLAASIRVFTRSVPLH